MPDEELLLIDLCARLPYDTIVNIDNGKYREDVKLRPCHLADFNVWNIRPYLRPMSEMTDEERNEFDEYTFEVISFFGQALEAGQLTDWLNAHHFDYRGLIPMGLALEAPDEMYNI